MSPVCDCCDSDITTNNRNHPGYCSRACADVAQAQRDWQASDRAQRTRDRAQQSHAQRPVNHLT